MATTSSVRRLVKRLEDNVVVLTVPPKQSDLKRQFSGRVGLDRGSFACPKAACRRLTACAGRHAAQADRY
jgi:hypothetical protein